MRLLSYRDGTDRGLGVMVDETGFVVLPRHAPALPRTMRGLLELGAGGLALARSTVARRNTADLDLAEVVLEPVVTDPQAIWCLGRNYREHAAEAGNPVLDHPMLFLRVTSSQTAHRRPIVLPKVSTMLDYEGELAVVIGNTARHVSECAALDCVAGYACYNDGSVRDWQRHTTQITSGKNFESTGAFGPWLVTADEFGTPGPQTLVTRLNGEEVQRATLDQMIFDVGKIIAYISAIATLHPGDVIVTGTPAGVGVFRKPPLFMKAGDVVAVEISGIGVLENTVTAEA